MNELATKKFENQSLAKATEEIISLQKKYALHQLEFGMIVFL